MAELVMTLSPEKTEQTSSQVPVEMTLLQTSAAARATPSALLRAHLHIEDIGSNLKINQRRHFHH